MAKQKPTGSKRWTAEEKLRVVLAAAAAGEAGLGELLRREGLHESDLERFRAEALEGLRDKLTARRAVYAGAYLRNPARWSGAPRAWKQPTAVRLSAESEQ
jgi:transposase-like protein